MPAMPEALPAVLSNIRFQRVTRKIFTRTEFFSVSIRTWIISARDQLRYFSLAARS